MLQATTVPPTCVYLATVTELEESSRACSSNFHVMVTVVQEVSTGNVYVMRHGERQDMIDSAWTSTAERAWDPPLSQFGVEQASKRGQEFASSGMRIDAVLCSPFERCIQTSCALMRTYGLPASKLIVDARLCEWMSPRNLNLDRLPAHSQPHLGGEVKGWFWKGPASGGIKKAVTTAWSADAAAHVRLARCDGGINEIADCIALVPARVPSA